jgi:hypothetical protein
MVFLSIAVKKFISFFSELKDSSLCSQKPTIGLYSDPTQSCPHSYTVSLKIHFNIIPFIPSSPNRALPSPGIQSKILYAFLFSHMYTMCSTHTLLHIMTKMITCVNAEKLGVYVNVLLPKCRKNHSIKVANKSLQFAVYMT